MWLALLAINTFKILCIFLFIVYCVVTFLMVMYTPRTQELKKCAIHQHASRDAEYPIESRDSVEDKLEVLTEKLTEKEHALQRSHCEIKNAEKVLNDLENKTSTCRDRYRSLVTELKRDVRKTEEEVKTLQNQISSLSVRREALRSEVLKQQQDYQKMLNNFTKELENKKSLFSTGIEKSRHSRVSCFALP